MTNLWMIPTFLIVIMITLGLPLIFFSNLFRRSHSRTCDHCHLAIPAIGSFCPLCAERQIATR